MNEAFEKILERFEEEIEFDTFDLYKEEPLIHMSYEKFEDIVQEVAEEYKNETYFNLDNTMLHKCPKCGGSAQHRVNQKGIWACGCFECKLYKSNCDHQKAIQEWEDYCREYNNGWIPVSERLPEKGGSYIVCSENKKVYLAYYCKNSVVPHWSRGKIIAWQPLPEPYKESDTYEV